MKIELVMTIWEDGLFRLRDRIEVNSFDDLKVQFSSAFITAKEKLAEMDRKKYAIAEDDDIPF